MEMIRSSHYRDCCWGGLIQWDGELVLLLFGFVGAARLLLHFSVVNIAVFFACFHKKRELFGNIWSLQYLHAREPFEIVVAGIWIRSALCVQMVAFLRLRVGM